PLPLPLPWSLTASGLALPTPCSRTLAPPTVPLVTWWASTLLLSCAFPVSTVAALPAALPLPLPAPGALTARLPLPSVGGGGGAALPSSSIDGSDTSRAGSGKATARSPLCDDDKSDSSMSCCEVIRRDTRWRVVFASALMSCSPESSILGGTPSAPPPLVSVE